MARLNTLFLKALIIIALAPAVFAVLVGNPPVGIILALIFLAWVVPAFRPFAALSRAFSSFFTGIAHMLAAFITGIFKFLTAIIAGPFKLLALGIRPRQGAKFLGGIDHWRLLGRGHDGLLVDGYHYRLTEKASFESVLTVGGMGRGKSSTFVIPNLLTLDDCSFVISDTSGELFERTSGDLARRGYTIRVLNLMNPQQSETYNPLLGASSYAQIGQAAEIIVRSALPGASKDAFWNAGAEKIIRIMIQCLKNNGDPAFTNLTNVKHLLANFDAHQTPHGQLGRIDQFVMNATANDPSTWTDYRGFVSGNDKTMLSFLSTADTALQAIGNPEIAALTATSSFAFDELRQGKTALYIIARQQELRYYQFLLNLFYTDLFRSLLHTAAPTQQPVYLLLDEFGHLQIPDFHVYATTARKYRVGFSIFLQSLSQLDARYGALDAQTIIDGLQTEIYLPGLSHDTARKLEARMGRMTAAKGQNTGKPLLTADEIIRMEDDRALMFHSNKRPKLLRTRPYYKQGRMKRASKRPPAALPSANLTMPSIVPL